MTGQISRPSSPLCQEQEVTPYRPIQRRTFLRSCVGGSLLLPAILTELLADQPPARQADNDPLAPREPHYAPKATRVIFLFSTGGVSHMDTFDYKPRLFQADGRMTGVGRR